MKILHNIFHYPLTLIAALIMMVLTMNSCDTSEIAYCYEGLRLRVVVVVTPDPETDDVRSERLEPGEMEDMTLYVFDEKEVLLDIRPTEVDKVELLYYPGAAKLNVAFTANLDSRVVDVTQFIPGTTKLQDVEIALKKAGNYLGYEYYEHPSDIFFGKIEVENVDHEGIIELPARRKVAAVMVRVSGLKEHIDAPEAEDDDFRVVLSTQYNKLNFLGEPGKPQGAGNYPVPYKLEGLSRTVFGKEYHEFPGQTSPDKTDYIRTISTDEGSPVSVAIYYKDQLVSGTPVTLDQQGQPILVRNDILNVILIEFSKGGGPVDVTIKDARWNGVVYIEKDFEQN